MSWGTSRTPFRVVTTPGLLVIATLSVVSVAAYMSSMAATAELADATLDDDGDPGTLPAVGELEDQAGAIVRQRGARIVEVLRVAIRCGGGSAERGGSTGERIDCGERRVEAGGQRPGRHPVAIADPPDVTLVADLRVLGGELIEGAIVPGGGVAVEQTGSRGDLGAEADRHHHRVGPGVRTDPPGSPRRPRSARR